MDTHTKPSLLDPAVVDTLVRRFTAECLDILSPPRKPTYMAAIDFECRRYNSLFLSWWPSEDYAQTAWNDQHELGMYILQAYRVNGDLRYGVRDACMLHLDRVVDAIKANESAEPAIAFLVAALLGVAHLDLGPPRAPGTVGHTSHANRPASPR
jgi:hypothetical protein